jgi:PhnB protein
VSAPSTAHTITAHLVVRGAADAADWYRSAFGARVGRRIPLPDGRFIEIELRIGDSSVMIADEFPEHGIHSPLALGGTYGALHIATNDVDTLWARAIDAGAQVIQPLADQFWGDRFGQVLDPYGHRWGLAEHVRDVPADEVARSAADAFA